MSAGSTNQQGQIFFCLLPSCRWHGLVAHMHAHVTALAAAPDNQRPPAPHLGLQLLHLRPQLVALVAGLFRLHAAGGGRGGAMGGASGG